MEDGGMSDLTIFLSMFDASGLATKHQASAAHPGHAAPERIRPHAAVVPGLKLLW